MFGSKKCHLCKKKIAKGKEITKDVEIYGRVGKWKKDFCSEEHLAFYEQRTEALMATRRPRVCCGFR